jgi:DNA-binding SARP family transcriptional activator
MQFRMLGRIEVQTAAGVTDVSSAPVRGLLVALMLAEGRCVPMHQLLSSLWDRPPRSARSNLRLYVARLRRQLYATSPQLKERLAMEPGDGGASYRLRADPDELDVSVFRRLSLCGQKQRQAGFPVEAEKTLSRALELWRGPICQNCTASEELRRQAETLEELRLTVRERLTAVRITLGHTTDLVPEINDLLRVAPYRELSYANLMRARYLAGDIDGALKTWTQAAKVLRCELGIGVSAELRELQHAMLRRDAKAVRAPALDGGPTMAV